MKRASSGLHSALGIAWVGILCARIGCGVSSFYSSQKAALYVGDTEFICTHSTGVRAGWKRRISRGGKTHILGLLTLARAQTTAVCLKLGTAADLVVLQHLEIILILPHTFLPSTRTVTISL